jgi:hypothetical protein
MEQLANYLKHIDVYELKRQYERDCYLESMRSYFGDDLPMYVIESALNDEYKDFILESLTTHDINLFTKKLITYFSDKCELDPISINDKGETIVVIAKDDITKDTQFDILLQVFGYYVTSKSFANDKYFVTICPNFAKDVNKMVYKSNHGKLYHFTSNKFADEIERSGLRCKSSKYRNFPERIYLYSSDKPLDKIPNINEFIKKVTNSFDRKHYGLFVYKIDLSKLSTQQLINFYSDDYMKEKEVVYTYNNIPSECITKIEYNF